MLRGRLGLAWMVLLLPGCGLWNTAVEAPERMVRAVVPGSEAPAKPTEELLPDLLRFADVIVLRCEEATQRFEEVAGTPAAELQAARWRLESLRWTTQIATGPNSLTAVLDLVIYSTILSYLQEDYWVPVVWGEAARPMLLAHQRAADDGWLLLQRYLPDAEVLQARAVISDWRATHPQLTESSLLEFPGFGQLAAGAGPAGQPGPSLADHLKLDPMSGLEPAMREMELIRQFGMRALYAFQRMPRLVAAEVEFRTLALRDSEEVRRLLDEVERVTASVESIAATAAALPAALSAEREAALAQSGELLDAQRAALFAAVTAEREAALTQVGEVLEAQRAGLLADLEQTQAPLESLLQETQAALAAGRDMSANLTATLQALDAFVGRFDKPEAAGAAAPDAASAAAASAPVEPGKPFDIAEYGRTAEQVGQAAAELRELVTSLEASLPEAQKLLDETVTRGERALDHAALRFLQVGLVLLGAVVLAVLLLRWRR